MSEHWYESVSPETRLTQGDLILECPVIGWKDAELLGGSQDELRAANDAFQADVIVMTQACDLEHEKVSNIVLCPHYSLATYYEEWKNTMQTKGMNPTKKAWDTHFEDLVNGFVWNAALINRGTANAVSIEHRVVDFHEVYTIPRRFLESWLVRQKAARLRLLPPYREHLSQAFARFFMRVGLPVPVERPSGFA